MIVSFSGDPFLVRRAARRALRELGVGPGELTELGEGMETEQVLQLAGQGGLFGRAALLLDFGEAFSGAAGTRPRDQTMDALAGLPHDAVVAVMDPEATPARQKRWAALGRHEHLPTPRFDAVPRFAKAELDAAGLRYQPDVPAVLAELFGEDPAGIASEVSKLAVLDEVLTAERVRQVAYRAAVHDAFDIVDAVAAGDAAQALTVARQLLDEGEAAQRVLAALAWQFALLAKAVALKGRAPGGRVATAQAAAVLKAKPFAVQKTLRLAADLDEEDVTAALGALLEAEVASKTGRDPSWALESALLTLAGRFRRAAPGRRGRR